eukprot:Sspe_Gene.73049::Locus_43848_Transcript_1_1_Confidence_1.000_Length_1318::g.73049::m.73049
MHIVALLSLSCALMGLMQCGMACTTDADCSNRGACTGGVCKCRLAVHGGESCDKCTPSYLYQYPACDVVCLPDTCMGRGSCSADGRCACSCNSTVCYAGTTCESCAVHYYGPSCDVFCDPHTSCSSRGVCTDTGECRCEEGRCGKSCGECCEGVYNWPECDVPCSPETTCSGHGVCKTSGKSCECDEGFQPPTCSTCAEGRYGYPLCTPCTGTWTKGSCHTAPPAPTPASDRPTASPFPTSTPSPPAPASDGNSVTWVVVPICVVVGVLIITLLGFAVARYRTTRVTIKGDRVLAVAPSSPGPLPPPLGSPVLGASSDEPVLGIPIAVTPSQPQAILCPTLPDSAISEC